MKENERLKKKLAQVSSPSIDSSLERKVNSLIHEVDLLRQHNNSLANQHD